MTFTQKYSSTLTYIKRATFCANPISRELFLIMEEKRSNLAVAVDVTTKEELLHFARTLGPYICVLKTHIDMIRDFDLHLLLELQDLAKKYRFLIFEDRKFADIGKTVQEQYEGGVHKIVNWSHMVTAHSVPGAGIIEGLRKIGLRQGKGLLLLAEMSSQGSLATGSYTEATVKMAKEYSDFVIGFIAQRKLVEEPYFIHMTPGVSISSNSDDLRQQYNNPDYVIGIQGSDVIIVGRGILNAENPQVAAKLYQETGWAAYERRIGKVALS